MTAPPNPFKPSTLAEANRQYQTGLDCISKNDNDAALTWFRRAAIADPNFFSAQMQIGLLCREKARLDKKFLRTAYDAFLKAASLDLANEDAHNQFILASSQAGKMEELLMSYEKWCLADPTNEMLQRCKKNVITLSMAMMPQSVDIKTDGNSGIKRLVLVGSIVFLALGLGLLTVTPMLVKSGKLKREQVGGVAPAGIAMTAAGFIGFLSRRFF